MGYEIKLQIFEGPLDLLLHLIDKAEVDIYDIPVAEITEQYLEYLYILQQLQMDIASEFIVMAATLLSIKSKMLLPRQELHHGDSSFLEYEEEDPREELIQRLLEYKKYKEVASSLREMEEERNKVYTRPAEDLLPYTNVQEPALQADISMYDLIDAFYRVLARSEQEEPMARIERDEISVVGKMRDIVRLLQVGGGTLTFTQIFLPPITRSEVVVTFLAMLELMRKKHVKCEQQRLFDDIVISLVHAQFDESGVENNLLDYQ